MGEAAPIRSEDAGVRGEAVVVAIFDRKLKFRNKHKEDSNQKINPRALKCSQDLALLF